MLYTNEFDIEGLVAIVEPGARPAGPARADPAGRGRLREGAAQPAPARRPLPARRTSAGRHQGGAAGRRAEGAGRPRASARARTPRRRTGSSGSWTGPTPAPSGWSIWGGSADLAQALWKVRATRSPEELDRFVSKLRVHAIGDQDSTGPWIREQFPGLYTITQRRAYRGMYRGGDTAPGLVRVGRGRTSTATGRSATSTRTTTAATSGPATLGRVRGIKEGDTPSFLSLVPNGLGDVEHPRLGSWGGRFEGEGETTDRRAGHGPGHLERPRPPDVVGLPLAAGVPGRLRSPAGLVRQALRRGQPPAGRADRRGPGAEGQGGRAWSPSTPAARPTRTAMGSASGGASIPRRVVEPGDRHRGPDDRRSPASGSRRVPPGARSRSS